MTTQRFMALLGATVAACLINTARAEDGESPFVCRTFGFFVEGSDLAPDYFIGEDSIAIVTPPEDGPSSDFCFAPCVDVNGELAGTIWISRSTRHVTKGKKLEVGTFVWLLTEDTPEPPPVGAMTLTGDGSPLVLSQTVVNVRQPGFVFCPGMQPGDLVVSTSGTPFVVVTALFNR